MSDLGFLRDKVNVYYSGLDYRAFPWNDLSRKIPIEKKWHIIYLKALALLVDHIAIPPTFLVNGMNPKDKNEKFVRSVIELFQTMTFITAVHGSMNDPLDFFEYKMNEGDEYERRLFYNRRKESKVFFSHVPLLHRDINSMSSTFKDLVLANIEKISEVTLPRYLKDKIQIEVNKVEASGEVKLSRSSFISLLEQKFSLAKHQYRACYYAMNSAYYLSGAITYNSDIACLAVEEYAVLGRDIFTSSNNGIRVGYDPIIFMSVLRCHNISPSEIENLNPLELEKLKKDTRFNNFIHNYREFIHILQKAELAISSWSNGKIQKFKWDIVVEIEKRFHTEQIKMARWALREDIGSGFFTTILGGVLGLLIAGPSGAAIGAGIGLVGPISKFFKFSASEIIASKLASGEFSFYQYVEYLKMKIEELESH